MSRQYQTHHCAAETLPKAKKRKDRDDHDDKTHDVDYSIHANSLVVETTLRNLAGSPPCGCRIVRCAAFSSGAPPCLHRSLKPISPNINCL